MAGTFTVIIGLLVSATGLTHSIMLYSVENGSPTDSVVPLPFKTGVPEKLTRENVVTPPFVKAVKKDIFFNLKEAVAVATSLM